MLLTHSEKQPTLEMRGGNGHLMLAMGKRALWNLTEVEATRSLR